MTSSVNLNLLTLLLCFCCSKATLADIADTENVYAQLPTIIVQRGHLTELLSLSQYTRAGGKLIFFFFLNYVGLCCYRCWHAPFQLISAFSSACLLRTGRILERHSITCFSLSVWKCAGLALPMLFSWFSFGIGFFSLLHIFAIWLLFQSPERGTVEHAQSVWPSLSAIMARIYMQK